MTKQEAMEFNRKETNVNNSTEVFETNLYPYIDKETEEVFYSLRNYTFDEMMALGVKGGCITESQNMILWGIDFDLYLNAALKTLPGDLDLQVIILIQMLEDLIKIGDNNMVSRKGQKQKESSYQSSGYDCGRYLIKVLDIIDPLDRRKAILDLQRILSHRFIDKETSFVLERMKFKKLKKSKGAHKNVDEIISRYDDLVEFEIFRDL